VAVDAVVEDAAAEGVDVAVEVPRVLVEDFRPQRERHGMLLLDLALGRAPAVAERLPLDLQEVAHQAHKVEPVRVLARRVQVRRPDSVREPVEEQREPLPGAQHPVNSIISSTFLVPVPAPLGQQVGDERAAQRPISCKVALQPSRREPPAVLPQVPQPTVREPTQVAPELLGRI
jgi:hypothetical protein